MRIPFLFFAACLLILSCQKKVDAPEEEKLRDSTTVDSPPKVAIPMCYAGSLGKDSFRMELEVYQGVASGQLSYLFHEKDQSTGTFKGLMMGDTLIADYTYDAEGTKSVRQIAYLINSISAKEGYGPMEEVNGKLVYANPKLLTFGKGVKMLKQACEASTSVGQQSSVLTGTWTLVNFVGEKVKFDQLYPNKKPRIIFSDTAPGDFAGTTGCNNIQGTYSLSPENHIHFGNNMVMTKMACEGDGESLFLKYLKLTDHFHVKENVLIFYKGEEAILRFTKE